MGLFKKGEGEEDSSNRKALFGRSKNKSPQPPANPYAKPIPTNPYQKAKIEAGVAPLPPSEMPPLSEKSGKPSEKSGKPSASPAPSGPTPPQLGEGGYTPNKFGNQGGYGTDRYGGGGGMGGPSAGASRYGPGGYGGLGSTDPNDPGDANRDALFAGSGSRAQQQPNGAPPPPYSEGDSATAQGGYGGYGGGSNEYNTAMYQERQLTAEEEEEEEIQTIKQEMRFVKQGDVASTRNALRVAAQAEESGRETLARLGGQGETVHDTERNLDLANIEGRLADEKARELKTLNKSMFHVHMSNPFTASRRRRERDEKILNTHRQDRDTREGTRTEAFHTNQRMERTFRDIDRESKKNGGKARANVTERAKYQFEADSEDEAMEDELEQNLDLIHGAAGRLNGLARATGHEIEEQNRHLERIGGKVGCRSLSSCSEHGTNIVPERFCRRPAGHEPGQTGPDSLGYSTGFFCSCWLCLHLELYLQGSRLPGAVKLIIMLLCTWDVSISLLWSLSDITVFITGFISLAFWLALFLRFIRSATVIICNLISDLSGKDPCLAIRH